MNGYSATIAWQLFQLPYAVVGISVITALLPRMSEPRRAPVFMSERLLVGVRLAAMIVVPATV